MRSKLIKPSSSRANGFFAKTGNQSSHGVQANLKANKPGAYDEIEADKSAENVVGQPMESILSGKSTLPGPDFGKPLPIAIRPSVRLSAQSKEEDLQANEEESGQLTESGIANEAKSDRGMGEEDPMEVVAAKNIAKDNPEEQQATENLVEEMVDKVKDQSPIKTIPNSTSDDEQLAERQPVDQGNSALAIKEQEPIVGDETVESLDEKVEQEITQKVKTDESSENQDGFDAIQNDTEKKKEKEKAQQIENTGAEGIHVNFENPPPVKVARVEEATDKVGEGVGIDEEANVNVEGLIMTAQQFRDQGKDSVDRAKAQTEHRLIAEQKMQQLEKKVEVSDKTLQQAQKNTLYREVHIPMIMNRALATSKQRQEKVTAEIGTYTSEYTKNKGTAHNLKKESAALTKGSKKNSNPEEKDSGALTSKYEEMSEGSAVMAEGISIAGSTAAKLGGDAKEAKAKNISTEKNLKEAKADIQKSKQKIFSEKNRNSEARSILKTLTPKFQSSKKQEEQLTTEGVELMQTSFEMESETHSAQDFYYADMKSVEGTDEMILQEELKAQGELSNGPEALMFRYSNMKSEGERDEYLASLSDSDRRMLGMQLEVFNMNFEPWIEAKKLEVGDRVEQKRAGKINEYNSKRNQGLESPLNKATKNIGRISKTGLLWTSMTKSLEAMWAGLRSVTWADVSKIGWAMVNPLETYRTIADAVGGIWTDLSDWKGFSDDPVGMTLQKGSSVSVKLLTISGVVTGLLLALSIVTGIAAVFIPPLWAVVAWLGSATATMATVTFWIGAITAAISVMSGIKSIFNVHTARTAEEIYHGNNQIKKDAANTAAGVLGVVGGKSVPKPINAEKIGKFKNVAVRTWKASSGFVKGGVRRIPRLVNATFKKQTWTDLYANFKKFSLRESDDLFGGNKKGIARKGDKVVDVAPKKALKNMDEPKVSSKPSTTKKPVDVETKTPTKNPHADTDIPTTKNIPATKASELKKIDADLEKPKNKQVADGEKPPKSEVLEDNPTLKEKELDNFKKYEDDIDGSKKKKMEEEADGEVGKGKDHNSKVKALIMARIIVEANDKVDTPIPGLLAELAPLKAMKGVKNFKAKAIGNGKFEIYLIASEIKVGDYDIDSYSSEFKKIEHNVGLPIEFGGDLMKREGVDLYVLGRTKGTKISGKSGRHAGTLNFKDIDGVEILNKPIPEKIKTRFPDSLSDQTQAYWDEINGPWLDRAIESGADIRFIQDPRLISNQVHMVTPIQKVNDPKIFGKIKEHKTYLNFEYRYLLKRGYVLNENGLMTKIKK